LAEPHAPIQQLLVGIVVQRDEQGVQFPPMVPAFDAVANTCVDLDMVDPPRHVRSYGCHALGMVR
jgi:hypothetical protein